MTERIRLFKGVTELNYSKASISKTNDDILNRGKVQIEANSNVTSSSVIDFKKADGSTLIFSAKVIEKKESSMWDLTVLTNGYELNTLRIEKVYAAGTSPEDIVEDIVDNFTNNLTYASTATSGVTYDGNYIAKGYAIDIIKEQMEVLSWQLVIDQNDNVYFEQRGDTDNGVFFTNGTNCQIIRWDEDKTTLVNHLKLKGGFESFSTEETISGTGTEFSLSFKPSGAVKAIVSGSEVSTDDYTVDAEDKKITFDSSKTNPTFSYSYDRPIVIDDQDDASINEHDEAFQELDRPSIQTFADGRRFTQNFLDSFSQPLTKVSLVEPGLNYDTEVGEIVTIQDPIRNKSDIKLVITKIDISAERNETVYELGTRVFIFEDWKKEVQNRIKKIEERFLNEQDSIFARTINNKMKVNLTLSKTFQKDSPLDTFVLNNPTLNRIRTVVNGHIENFEADCSDNNNDGTWYGTGINGSQFGFGSYDDLIVHCKFNGDATDEQGNVTLSDVGTPTYTTGKLDQAIDVTNTNHINDSSFTNIGATDNYTVCFWLKLSDSSQTYSIIDMSGVNSYPRITIQGSGRILMYYGQEEYLYSNTNVITDNTWHHVVCIMNDYTDNSTWKIYIDGVDQTGLTGAFNVAYFNPSALKVIGDDSYDTEIDDFRIYDIILTEDDIEEIYNSGTGEEKQLIDVPRLGYGEFNGSDNYIDSSNNFYDNTGYSIAFWVKNKDINQADKRYYSEGRLAVGTPAFLFGTQTGGSPNNRTRLFIRDDSNNAILNKTGNTTMNQDKWYHIVWTDNNGDAHLYIDGVEDTADFTYTSSTLTLDLATIGALRLGGSTGNYINADMDEFMIFEGIITSADITKLMANTFYDSNNDYDLTITPSLHYSFDNPKLGIRRTARSDVL